MGEARLDSFCVFILTHGRPHNVRTVKALEKSGYTGPWYLVVDDQDSSLHQYIDAFGESRVIIFSKKVEAESCDLGNNLGELRGILLARNACFRIAKELGFTYFLELDDDYTAFRYRVVEIGNSVAIVKNLDRLFKAVLRFYVQSGASAIALAQGGDFLGGIDNGIRAYRFSKRKCMNSFFCSTERPFKFIGIINEDVNAYTVLGSRGVLFLTIPCASIEQAATQSQKGGMTGQYKESGTYVKSFSTVMMMPSAVKVAMMKSTHHRLHHTINWKVTAPCIVPRDCSMNIAY